MKKLWKLVKGRMAEPEGDAKREMKGIRNEGATEGDEKYEKIRRTIRKKES